MAFFKKGKDEDKEKKEDLIEDGIVTGDDTEIEDTELPETKKKAILITAIAGGVILFLLIVATMPKGSKKQIVVQNPENQKEEVQEPVQNVEILRERWMVQSQKEIDSLKAVTQAIQKQLMDISMQIGNLRADLLKAQRVNAIPQRTTVTPPPPPSGTAAGGAAPVAPGQTTEKKAIQEFTPTDTTSESTGQIVPEETPPGIIDVANKKGYIYIPSGSYARVTLLTGVDAPAGNRAEPYPVLMKVVGQFQLPNNQAANEPLDCFVLGAAKGNLSTERADIKLEKLSCVWSNSKKKAIDMEIKGWVIDARDGKLGIKGKLVSRQGEKLAYSVIANIAESAGRIGERSQFTETYNPLGGITTTLTGDVKKAAAYAALEGVGKDLSRWYMQRANEIFPVIEIEAGTPGVIMLMEGKQIKVDKEVKDERGFFDVDSNY